MQLLAGCVANGFGDGERTPAPEAPLCPSSADCSDRECGPDPVCAEHCGSCSGGLACDPSGTCCQPESCESLGAACGEVPDGCGGTLSCGECSGNDECSVDLLNHCGCARPDPEGTALLRLPRVEVTFHVLLDGEELSTLNTTASDRGSFFFEWLDGDLGGSFDAVTIAPWSEKSGAPLSTFTLPFVPGQYRVWYRREGTDPASPWPRNRRAKWIEILAEEGAYVELDVPVARVRPIVEIDGNEELWADEGTALSPLWLVGGEGDEAPLLPAGADGAPVFPDEYQALYRRLPESWTEADPWPLGDDVALGAFRADGTTPDVVYEIVSDTLSVDLLLDGARPTAATLGASVGASLRLSSPHRTIDLGLLRPTGTDTIDLPRSVRIAGGRWTLGWSRSPAFGVEDGWPVSGGHLADDLAGGSVVAELQTTTLDLGVTLDGEPLSSANTAAHDHGDLVLRGQGVEPWVIPPLWNADLGIVDDPAPVRVAHGQYEVAYTSGERTGLVRWPESREAVTVEGGIVVAGPTTRTVPIRTVLWSLSASYSGQALPAWPADRGEPPRLKLWRASGGSGGSPGNAPAHVLWDLDEGATDRRVLPGEWHIVYEAAPLSVDPFPMSDAVLQTSIEVLTDHDTHVNIEAAPYEWRLALGDSIVENADLDEADHPALDLTRPEPRATLHMLRFFAGGVGQPSVRVWTPGGFWFIHYYPGWRTDEGSAAAPADRLRRWPVAAALKLGCVTPPGFP